MPKDSPVPSIDSGRRFEWAAKIELNDSRKYVGMRGTTPLILVNNSIRLEAYWLDWKETNFNKRAKIGSQPSGLPTIRFSDFASNQLVGSGQTMYRLNATDKTIRDALTDMELDSKFRLPGTATFPMFRQPSQNAVMIPIAPSKSEFHSSVLIRWDDLTSLVYESSDPPATALVLGDLDGSDVLPNGNEAMLFSGGKVQAILHQLAPSVPDPGLQQGLQAALDRTQKDWAISAGYVSELNNDRAIDFVYARGPKVYVTSYLGRNSSGRGQFADWPTESFPPLTGELVRSLVAVNLDEDSAPDLVVETDKYVHFYLNRAR
jgi:hypothetical protein